MKIQKTFLKKDTLPRRFDVRVYLRETFNNRVEAEMAKGVLESEEIDAIIETDDLGGLQPGMTFTRGAKLMVKEESAEAARSILKSIENSQLYPRVISQEYYQ